MKSIQFSAVAVDVPEQKLAIVLNPAAPFLFARFDKRPPIRAGEHFMLMNEGRCVGIAQCCKLTRLSRGVWVIYWPASSFEAAN